MDDFSVLAGPYICVDATQEKEWNSLHALMGIGKGEGSGIICIRYLYLTFCHKFLQGSVAQWIRRETSNPKIRGTKPGASKTLFFYVELFYLLRSYYPRIRTTTYTQWGKSFLKVAL